MKIQYCIFLGIMVLFFMACDTKKKELIDHTSLPPEATYLGQKPPGIKAEVFAPGIVSKEHMAFFGSFTPDLKEFYFLRKGGDFKKATLVVMQLKNKKWIESVVPFAESFAGEPTVSPDGNIIYLDHRYIERTDMGWSEVKSLGKPFEDIPIMRLTASRNGTYVFDIKEEIGNIQYSRLIDEKHEAPKAFGKEINSGKWTAHPFIATDESYLIWDSEREDGFGETDLYISFRQDDGSYGPAINMGAHINSELNELFASVSPDGKYLFFHRYFGKGQASIFWADAQLIERLRPIP